MNRFQPFETKHHREGKRRGLIIGKIESTKANIVTLLAVRTTKSESVIQSELEQELETINENNYNLAFRALVEKDMSTIVEAKDILRNFLNEELWQLGEQEAQRDIDQGNTETFHSTESLFRDLHDE
ncbi:hypothetical protein IMZ31_19530 (plasmid) [Pontibacillus sp. ALD_SL1]|uniref:hypothetical protein n=1 Tax=Pontibacillus sp. ALD_SL1 TaxID=2777185 RepID=UPI001A962681|nr:hypothetical protein [Pontibacillus sp. ALD_SL1]QST02743.1 hypothetical protein IMZ31_19530 [Pontibacillus sp. ALD_SL1]